MSIRDSAGLVATYAWGWQQDATNPRTGAYFMVCDSSLVSGYADTLQPWKGYWVRASGACDLILPPPE